MTKLKLFNKNPKVAPKFRKFNVVFKSADDIDLKVKSDRTWQKMGKRIMSRRGLAALGIGAGGVGLGVYVADYIHANSGCFLYDDKNDIICKVKEYSCCNTDDVSGIRACDASKVQTVNACRGYTTSGETSCCRQCNCESYVCEKNQQLKCRAPSIGEAFSHAIEETGLNLKTIFDYFFEMILPTLKPIFIGIIVVLLILFFGRLIRK